MLLPGLAWGLAGRLRPVEYPADWSRARQVIDGDPHPGTVLLLPWAAYRRYPWNHGEAVFDPWPRFVGREVISNDALQVGPLTLAPESADSVRLNRIVTAAGPAHRRAARGGGPVRDRRRRPGAGAAAAGRPAAVTRGQHSAAGPSAASSAALAALARLPGAQVVIAGRDLVLFRLPPARLAEMAGKAVVSEKKVMFAPAYCVLIGQPLLSGNRLPRAVTRAADGRGPGQGGSPCHVLH